MVMRIIKVSDCITCPLSRKRNTRDLRICTHPDLDGMEVGEYWDTEVDPDCPLPKEEQS